jgi:hypothetical protein
MMQFDRITTILLLVTALFAGSCTEEVNIDLDSTYTRLVVDGQITTDTTRHYVRLSKTLDYFSNRPAEPVSGAHVMINDHLLTESDSIPGMYLTDPDYYGEIGKNYTLLVENVDVDADGSTETYTASSHIPSIARADSLEIVYLQFGGIMEMWGINLYAQDPPDQNYYLFKVLKNDTLVTDTIDEYVIQEDLTFNGNYVPGVMVQSLEKSKKDEIVRSGDKITLEVNGITPEYYKYIIELTNEAGPSNPLFSGPRANVRTNVEGGQGAVGFFRAFSVSRMSVKVADPYGEKQIAINKSQIANKLQ